MNILVDEWIEREREIEEKKERKKERGGFSNEVVEKVNEGFLGKGMNKSNLNRIILTFVLLCQPKTKVIIRMAFVGMLIVVQSVKVDIRPY